MKSRLSPINKNGVKIVTLGLLASIFVAAHESGGDIGGASAWVAVKEKKYSIAATRFLKAMNPMSGHTAGNLVTGSVVVGASARMLDVKSFSFVQLS